MKPEDSINNKRRKRIVVFGIFDGIHAGHRDFFRQCKKYGDELIVIVGRDEIASRLKSKKPRHTEDERIELVKQEQLPDEAILGDQEMSTYEVVLRLDPDVICLGYDQQALREDLQKWMRAQKKKIPTHMLKPYKPDSLHNSLKGKGRIL